MNLKRSASTITGLILTSTLLLTGCTTDEPAKDTTSSVADEVDEKATPVDASAFANAFFISVLNLSDDEVTQWQANYDLTVGSIPDGTEDDYLTVKEQVLSLNPLFDMVHYSDAVSAKEVVLAEGMLIQKIVEWRSAGERSVTPDMIVMISDTEAVLDAGLGFIDHTEDDYLEGDGHNEEHHAEDGHDHSEEKQAELETTSPSSGYVPIDPVLGLVYTDGIWKTSPALTATF